MATPVEGCLDQAATVAATQSLRENGIRTIVVGFGGEAGTGEASSVKSKPSLVTGLA